MTVGTQRFRLAELDQSRPYLQGQVDLLAENSGDEAAAALAAQAVQVAFRSYLGTLAAQGVAQVSVPDLPDEPVLLSYLVASSMIVDLSDRQVLLAEPDALRRLTAERALLSREIAILRSLGSGGTGSGALALQPELSNRAGVGIDVKRNVTGCARSLLLPAASVAPDAPPVSSLRCGRSRPGRWRPVMSTTMSAKRTSRSWMARATVRATRETATREMARARMRMKPANSRRRRRPGLT